ncbi:MAG: ribosome-associated translation inhibitor RaiA [Thiopseudomonas sp.]|nr:ribosome-associated translation inhibitor RaiA [Thiopseudomonas sp.]
MQITITGHQLEVTDALREYINTKFDRLARHSDKITSIRVTLSVEKINQTVDASILIAGGEVNAQAEHEDMYAAIDLLIDKLDRQLLKHKEKQLDRQKGVTER